jgi:hypothetical protein
MFEKDDLPSINGTRLASPVARLRAMVASGKTKSSSDWLKTKGFVPLDRVESR